MEKTNHAITTLTRVLKVSRSAYYAWCNRQPSAKEREDAKLTETIEGIHENSHGTYGAPRIHVELREDHGLRIGRKRVARLMREAGLVGVHRRRNKHPKDAKPKREVFDDLIEREFTVDAPDSVYVADITSHETAEGWLHLAAVMDLFQRQIVGWSMATHLRGELVLQALEMAIRNRQPSLGAVHHSDHGAQLGFKGS